MDFIPSTPSKSQTVPYYEDATAELGWQGQTTGKSIETLQVEIMKVIAQLGGVSAGFQRGTFQTSGDTRSREGFRVHYSLNSPNGKLIPGRIDIAALPVKNSYALRHTYEKRKNGALKMALYMLRQSLSGLWFLQQLSPGYAALMPWMLSGDKTITQLWGESAVLTNLLPPGDANFIEGDLDGN